MKAARKKTEFDADGLPRLNPHARYNAHAVRAMIAEDRRRRPYLETPQKMVAAQIDLVAANELRIEAGIPHGVPHYAALGHMRELRKYYARRNEPATFWSKLRALFSPSHA